MTTTAYFENALLDAITALVMVPVNAAYCLVWLLWQGAVWLWPYRRYIALAIVAAAFVALCVACPMLPVGLAIIAAYAWVTMPRKAVCA